MRIKTLRGRVSLTKVRKLIVVLALGATGSGLAGFYYSQVHIQGVEGAPTSNIPVREPGDAARALQAASAVTGFVPEQPTHFPTSASRLVLVDSSAGPNAAGLKLVELVYQGDNSVMTRGQVISSTLEFFQTQVRLSEPQGDRLALAALPDVEVYRRVVDVNEKGEPVKVTYTVLFAKKTFVMDFTGEIPSDTGLAEMLRSFPTTK